MTKAELQAVLDNGRFHHFLRMEILSIDEEGKRVVLQLPYRPEYQRQADTGQIHGGIVSAFIDIAGTFAVVAVVGHGVPTINLRVDYLRAATATTLTATATVLRAGRTVAVVDIDLRDEQGRQVAVGRGTYGTQAA
jgi:uncharacterized protein (TIGR00369 family)